MILSINPDLLHIEDVVIQSELAEIVSLFFDGYYIWDIDNVDDLFLNNEDFTDSLFYKRFLSIHQQDVLLSKVSEIVSLTAYQTQIHNKYLTKLRIGISPEETKPVQGLKLLKTEARIILENAANDWKFICGMVNKYANHDEMKSIYKLIQKSINSHRLEPENAAGIGGIIHRYEQLANEKFQTIADKKLMALFDSDRTNPEVLKTEQKKIIEYFKNGHEINAIDEAVYTEGDLITWHMLYKRGIENYLPISVLNNIIPTEIFSQLETLTAQELDFFYFDPKEFTSFDYDLKNDLPPLFLQDWTRDLIENRCSHHFQTIELPNGTLRPVCEIESILLKIVKLI